MKYKRKGSLPDLKRTAIFLHQIKYFLVKSEQIKKWIIYYGKNNLIFYLTLRIDEIRQKLSSKFRHQFKLQRKYKEKGVFQIPDLKATATDCRHVLLDA